VGRTSFYLIFQKRLELANESIDTTRIYGKVGKGIYMTEKVDKAALQKRLRALPQVSAILERPDVAELVKQNGISGITRAIREQIATRRQTLLSPNINNADLEDFELSANDILDTLQKSQMASPPRVLNGTGVIIHTNLGRAPLSRVALAAASEASEGYSALEYDLATGKRGSRHFLARSVLQDLTQAEDAAVVNNCAAAVLLSLSALAKDREVIISRGELVEIGGGFRVPDVMQQSGCHLVEVGTTNKTRTTDYENAIGPNTALLLSVHRSNFAVIGFTEEADIKDLAKLAHAHGLPLVVDAGSGYLQLMDGCKGETTVSKLIELGVDLVTFSGDKLLGGPQAGLIVGKKELVEVIRKHPLMRALRPDKLTLAALIATLQLWRDNPNEIPIVRMIQATIVELTERAQELKVFLSSAFPEIDFQIKSTTAQIGGGTSPLATVESVAIAFSLPRLNNFASTLRSGDLPLIARIEDSLVVIDLRTILKTDDATLKNLLHNALKTVVS
jgi:L-seryl-tRNA(Ser) seleniumtransferase